MRSLLKGTNYLDVSDFQWFIVGYGRAFIKYTIDNGPFNVSCA